MKNTFWFGLIGLLISFNSLNGQGHIPIFEGQTGDQLLDNVVDEYKTETTLTYGMARDTMFSKIYNHDDSLTCVYTGFTIWLDPTLDPTQAAFMDGGPDAINTEHTYPQSLGATGIARSDMHHLYPTRANVNNIRSNDQFGENADAQTTTWFYLNQDMGNIPSSNIDAYSEYRNGSFEPREDHKGNVARAIFYFYTMYENQADMPFFEAQISTLCDWHVLDPVDELEWNRTFQIAEYQEDKPNPFILDCTLLERSYCQDFMIECVPLMLNDEEQQTFFKLGQNSPNPFQQNTFIPYELDHSYHVQIKIINSHGQEIMSLVDEHQQAGKHIVEINQADILPNGLLFYQMILTKDDSTFLSIKKMVKN